MPSRKDVSAALARLTYTFWANPRLAKVARALGLRSAYRFVQRRLFPPQILDITIHGEKFRFLFSQADEPYANGGEDDTIIPLSRMVRPGATVLDVGANHGYTTIYCARRAGPDGLVLSFEPDARHATYLRKNLELNGVTNARVVMAAAGASEAKATFHHDRVGDGGKAGGEGQEVLVTTLDAVVAAQSIRHVDVMKIDVEGYEHEVLRGAEGILKMRPQILLELHPEFLAERGTKPTAPLEFLQARGYSLHGVERATGRFELVPFDTRDLRDVMQVVALPEEARGAPPAQG